MPCDSVITVENNLKVAGDTGTLAEAVAKLGGRGTAGQFWFYHVYHNEQHIITGSINAEGRVDLRARGSDKAQSEQLAKAAGVALTRECSRQVVLRQAKSKGWLVKEEKNGSIYITKR